jgi:hypothetical protein
MRAARSIALALAVTAATVLPASVARAAHVFDLAAKMPPRLAVMWAVNWFGVPKSDPQPGGADKSYSNWKFTASSATCTIDDDPSKCVDVPGKGPQRFVASKRHPLAGIYSSGGTTDESKRRIDLMLSTLRRPCDDGARFDAFEIQLNSLKLSSLHGSTTGGESIELSYRALLGFLDRADAQGMENAVVVGHDSTFYWHFGDGYGIDTQAKRLAAMTEDLADMVAIADTHESAVHVDGRPLFFLYVDSALATAAEWSTVLEGARAKSGKDFYALATTLNTTYFEPFDALSPWVNLGVWDGAKGASLHDRAIAYQTQMHAGLLSEVGKHPGRVVFGSAAPGFDDFTMDWGACRAREIPRDPQVLAGQLDHLASLKKTGTDLRGLVLETWDDWTEGTEFEPDVEGGTEKLVQLRQLLGTLYGDPADPKGDARLDARWMGFGQPRSCCFTTGTCGDAGPPAPIDLHCPPPGADAGTMDTGVDADADATASDAALVTDARGADGAGGDDAGNATPPSDDAGGCSCRIGGDRRIEHFGIAPAALLAAMFRRWRRRRERSVSHRPALRRHQHARR